MRCNMSNYCPEQGVGVGKIFEELMEYFLSKFDEN